MMSNNSIGQYKIKKLSPKILTNLGINKEVKPEYKTYKFKDGYGEKHDISYKGYLMIEQYLNPRTPSPQEIKRRKRLILMERKRRLDEAALARWEQRYWEQIVPGGISGPSGTGETVEQLEFLAERAGGIGAWQIGDSFIVG
tara:strand:+ start:181 stop:606 length:426 start_codon:yes stop_codon:yes gene_type:complete